MGEGRVGVVGGGGRGRETVGEWAGKREMDQREKQIIVDQQKVFALKAEDHCSRIWEHRFFILPHKGASVPSAAV